MRKTERSGGFFLCLLLNIFLNPERFIIAAALFALHLWVDIPLWISLLVLGIWLVIIIAQMLLSGGQAAAEASILLPGGTKTHIRQMPTHTKSIRRYVINKNFFERGLHKWDL